MLASAFVQAAEIVTTQNFVRAESDMQMKAYVDNFDSFGQFHHNHAMYDVTKQLTIRPNTDALYSFGDCAGVDNCLEIMDGWDYATLPQ